MALSSVPFSEFESQVRAQTGAMNYSDPNSALIMRWTNILIAKIFLLTRGIDGSWGRNTATLTKALALGKIIEPDGGYTYTSSTKTLTTPTIDQTYVGGWVFLEDKANSRGFYGVIDSVAVAGTSCVLRFQIGTGAVANIASVNIFALLKPNPSYYNGANLSGASCHDIVKIVDSSLGNAVRFTGDEFSSLSSNPSYASSIVTEYAGDAVYVDKGSSAGSYGTWTLSFSEKPATISSSSSVLDIRPEHIAILKDEVSNWVLSYMKNVQKKEVPEGNSAMSQLEEKYKKHAQDMIQQRMGYKPAKRV
jgi:hypothetical protein